MIETVEFNGRLYPKFQTNGNAARFVLPFASEVCKGYGFDIGCKHEEWSFPGSVKIDPVLDPKYHALNLPESNPDYIFSSHCLEHIESPWYTILKYWVRVLKKDGTIFLYLPDYSQEYWRPWNCNKHFHIFTPEILYDALTSLNLKNIFVSGVDLNSSFIAMGQK